MRLILFFVLILVIPLSMFAQQDSTTQSITRHQEVAQVPLTVLDSVVLATQIRQKQIADSLALRYIRYPDASFVSQADTAFLKKHLYQGRNFLDLPYHPKSSAQFGRVRPSRDQWILFTMIGLLLYTALLNLIWNDEIKIVVQSFYLKRTLAKAGKEERRVSTGAFIGLFILFGLTFGFLLCQLAGYKNVYYSFSGFALFLWLSAVVVVLFAAKFLVLKAIAFIFDVHRAVNEYIVLLYTTYINAAFVFLPVTLCFCLLAAAYIHFLLVAVFILLGGVFAWLYLRSTVTIISNFRFHKFYLIVYLCALEICPVLILIKALKYNI